MQHGDGVAEAFDEATDDLRRQRDLRNQHDRSAPLLERCRRGAQVDLGLPGAGHAVQQPLLRASLTESSDQRRERGLLVVRELRRPRAARADPEVMRACDRAARATAQPARGTGRQHERERAGDRGAVLGGDPLGQREEVDGHAELERA